MSLLTVPSSGGRHQVGGVTRHSVTFPGRVGSLVAIPGRTDGWRMDGRWANLPARTPAGGAPPAGQSPPHCPRGGAAPDADVGAGSSSSARRGRDDRVDRVFDVTGRDPTTQERDATQEARETRRGQRCRRDRPRPTGWSGAGLGGVAVSWVGGQLQRAPYTGAALRAPSTCPARRAGDAPTVGHCGGGLVCPAPRPAGTPATAARGSAHPIGLGVLLELDPGRRGPRHVGPRPSLLSVCRQLKRTT